MHTTCKASWPWVPDSQVTSSGPSCIEKPAVSRNLPLSWLSYLHSRDLGPELPSSESSVFFYPESAGVPRASIAAPPLLSSEPPGQLVCTLLLQAQGTSVHSPSPPGSPIPTTAKQVVISPSALLTAPVSSSQPGPVSPSPPLPHSAPTWGASLPGLSSPIHSTLLHCPGLSLTPGISISKTLS